MQVSRWKHRTHIHVTWCSVLVFDENVFPFASLSFPHDLSKLVSATVFPDSEPVIQGASIYAQLASYHLSMSTNPEGSCTSNSLQYFGVPQNDGTGQGSGTGHRTGVHCSNLCRRTSLRTKSSWNQPGLIFTDPDRVMDTNAATENELLATPSPTSPSQPPAPPPVHSMVTCTLRQHLEAETAHRWHNVLWSTSSSFFLPHHRHIMMPYLNLLGELLWKMNILLSTRLVLGFWSLNQHALILLAANEFSRQNIILMVPLRNIRRNMSHVVSVNNLEWIVKKLVVQLLNFATTYNPPCALIGCLSWLVS